ncbi:S41 family peptidase [Myroides sp. LJL116]
MRRIKHKIAIVGFSLLALSSLTVLNSCSSDDSTITDPRRFTAADVQSYEDLFVVFWKTMDQQYNYFYEQKEQGMDWDAIYKEYLPKFAALKTYGRPGEDDGQINEDYLMAESYFEQIIDPIIDQHFNVKIQFPATSKNVIRTVTFYGGMLAETRPTNYPFIPKFNYMVNRVQKDAFVLNNTNLGIIAGRLQENPEIFYLTYNQFNVTSTLKITLAENYLNPDPGNALLLTQDILNDLESLKAIEDQAVRENIRDITFGILETYNSFPNSEVFANYMAEVAKFNATEIVSDELMVAAQRAYVAYMQLPQFNTIGPYGPSYNAQTADYVGDFIGLMTNHVNFGYNFTQFNNGLVQVLTRGEFYQVFLNPLHKGDIKKIVIDLRSNGGGAVIDARFISDRFITSSEVFAYQRTREGNGRFNYTPWVEATTHPHEFGIPANIPIAILTDKGSASMSEITTLMLKSQGDQVVSVGDYSAGATAGLGTTDDFNGGTRDAIAGGKLSFYMPLLAMKDAKGVVVEGIGIKPEFPVTPLTPEEMSQMNSVDFDDKVLNQAIEYLNSK